MTGQILLVVGLAAGVALIIFLLRWLPVNRSRAVVASGWDPGVYLLSSEGCDNCAQARAELDRRSVRYREIVWQHEPEFFNQTGVDAVPSVVVVDESGSGRWWRGGVPRHLPGIGRRAG